ncbi:MAG: hypothetical protein RLZZ336_1172 [Cyanobacteriota bacterium]|jgi:hypothetical protein
MKNAVVATTAARGAAVSSSRITAVQSVYMGLRPGLGQHSHIRWPRRPSGLAAAAAIGAVLTLTATTARAGVLFENCVSGPDGAITCDTRPTGNTLLDDEAARFGLFNQASPGWAEYNPYEGYDQMLGGGSW